MTSFTFFKIRGSAVPGFEVEIFDDLQQARTHALKLLEASNCEAVEVWNDDFVDKLTATQAA